ncbi:hypothetical protein EAS64_04410 [Trebonia kvetii]|uniref:Uncharacterized protein n=1 Tax=Trebonia kvetii TaxID=2480626 RepID=A0A6P2C634_9ACTN|nr:hypothetical protein [Trebonia kvetii]TVZ06630.1 hypothetical protein EAS64_04410 [Trebonia kvetii]
MMTAIWYCSPSPAAASQEVNVPNASSKRSRMPSRASMPGTAFITTEVAGQYCPAIPAGD